MSSFKSPSDDDWGEARQWLPPDVNGGKVNHQSTMQPPSAPPTAAALEQLQQSAYTEGYEQGQKEGFEFGHKEGLEKAKQELQHYTNQLDRLLSSFENPLQDLDNQVERELLSLVISIVRQLVRREVKSDPQMIIGVIREALSILPVSARNVRLVVHPEDAALIRDIYALSEIEVGWNLVEDLVINRGGCKVVTDTSQIDATLESRLASLIAPLLAGARAVDEQEGDE